MVKGEVVVELSGESFRSPIPTLHQTNNFEKRPTKPLTPKHLIDLPSSSEEVQVIGSQTLLKKLMGNSDSEEAERGATT